MTWRSVIIGAIGLGTAALVIGALWLPAESSRSAGSATATASTPTTPERPARATATPDPNATQAEPALASTPTLSPTPATECAAQFPIDSVEAIEPGRTTIAQVEASFGQADHVGGRPLQFRFYEGDCELRVMAGVNEALEVELIDYGTLGWLLERYGPPDTTAVTEGNLTQILPDVTVLLYPEEGILAELEALPEDLTRASLIDSLVFRPPFEIDEQLTRLNARAVDWLPPLR